MGVIKGLIVIAATICNSFAFMMFASTRFQTLMPAIVTPNSPITALALGALLLSIWALLD